MNECYESKCTPVTACLQKFNCKEQLRVSMYHELEAIESELSTLRNNNQRFLWKIEWASVGSPLPDQCADLAIDNDRPLERIANRIAWLREQLQIEVKEYARLLELL